MRTADFDFHLPLELIAQHPAPKREQSRLLVLERCTGNLLHQRFPDLTRYLRSGDILVLNNSKVIPARIRGQNVETAGQFEILLLEENGTNDWWVMLRPGKRARVGTRIRLRDVHGNISDLEALVVETNEEGHRRLQFSGAASIFECLDSLGEIPLPPYIERKNGLDIEDKERYQTVFATTPGSVAAPTAGLHFTESVLNDIRGLGVEIHFVTLHVGLGTFAPVKSETITGHKMHEERFEIGEATAEAILRARAQGNRVFAVGTTAMRALETWGSVNHDQPKAFSGKTRIFIYPPYHFKVVDALLTNFHLPRSTLLMLVSAFAAPGETQGRELIQRAYAEAIRERYRFFSYGDAMLLV